MGLVQLAQAPNFSLNTNLPDVAKLFDSKSVALVTNVGTLMEPTTRAQYLAGTTLPTNLFSHTDQQLEWQNASQSGATPSGWAGRIADTISANVNPNGKIPMITSVAGDTLFCNGSASTPVSVSPGNLGGANCSEGTTECAAQQATAQALLSFSSGSEPGAGGQLDHDGCVLVCEDAVGRGAVFEPAADGVSRRRALGRS